MLQKMGWSEGKGLGVSGDGALEHIKVKTKYDTSGMDKTWIHNVVCCVATYYGCVIILILFTVIV